MATGKDTLLGLDIGASSLRLCELSVNKTGFTLKRLITKNLKSYATENGMITDFGELVQGIISIMKDSALSKKPVAVALKGPSVLIRRVNVYSEKPNELPEIFPWIADQYIPIDPEEYSMDFNILSISERYNHSSVLVTAAKKDTVIDFVSAMQSAGITPQVIEPEAMSLIRVYRALGLGKKAVSMILHIGYVGSFVLFVRDGVFDFSMDISVGGKHCTSLLKSKFMIDDNYAEKIKINPQLDKKSGSIIDTLEDFFSTEYITELDEVVKLYKLRGGKSLDNIYLSGGGALSFGLRESLVSKYSIQVEFLDPWKVIKVPEEYKEIPSSTSRLSYPVSIGLAMCGLVY